MSETADPVGVASEVLFARRRRKRPEIIAEHIRNLIAEQRPQARRPAAA